MFVRRNRTYYDFPSGIMTENRLHASTRIDVKRLCCIHYAAARGNIGATHACLFRSYCWEISKFYARNRHQRSTPAALSALSMASRNLAARAIGIDVIGGVEEEAAAAVRRIVAERRSLCTDGNHCGNLSASKFRIVTARQVKWALT